jgi:TonB family protein
VAVLPVVRTPPDYPPAALARKLEGWVQLQFTITTKGSVDDVTVVDSSDAIFEAPAAHALSAWGYLPQVVAGKRVPARDVQTIIRFALAPDPLPNADADNTPADQTARANAELRAEARNIAYLGVQRALTTAWQRVSAEDLRGAELELDELRATFELDARQQAGLWDFYAYIYTQYRDYGRAIAAYQSSIAIYDTLPGGAGGQRIALADLYFARHQYDLALKTVLPYKKADGKAKYPGADAMIEKLRALGVTEDTL